MANKKRIAMEIGAVVGVGVMVLAGLWLGKTKGVEYLGKCHRKK